MTENEISPRYAGGDLFCKLHIAKIKKSNTGSKVSVPSVVKNDLSTIGTKQDASNVELFQQSVWFKR